jgi:hypothetical protein
MQVILYGPRSFAEMTPDERLRACYHHAVLKFLSGERMKNASLGARFGIDPKIGLADELGSGTRRLFKYCKLYSGHDPELVEADVFRFDLALSEAAASAPTKAATGRS